MSRIGRKRKLIPVINSAITVSGMKSDQHLSRSENAACSHINAVNAKMKTHVKTTAISVKLTFDIPL